MDVIYIVDEILTSILWWIKKMCVCPMECWILACYASYDIKNPSLRCCENKSVQLPREKWIF